ncbi:MAG: MIP family channel protein [Acidobacteria bacterium]|nr:MIP family channel protein [Acidobacteriota bacterium]
MKPTLPRRLLAEALGVFALVTAGCGAILVEAQTGALGHLGVALAFGLVITVMVAATGHISGAHLNPAVTLAFSLIRHFPAPEVPLYAGAQLVGGAAGALALRALFGPSASLGVTLPAGSAGQSLGLEVLLTAVLMFVITAVATDTRAVGETAALCIGATVALGALWGGPVSGASMNPARSFGPALVAGQWQHHWVYWLGPIVGALLGAVLYKILQGGSEEGKSLPPETPTA